MSIQYRHPKIYDFLISFVYSKELLERLYKEVGRNQTIFDVAAGYGRMSKLIDPSNSYYGIDLNKTFVEHGQRQGVNLELKDICDPAAYRKSDIFLVVDVIHHLAPKKMQDMLNLVFTNSINKVIVLEPAFLNLSNRYPIIGNLIDWLFKKMDDDGFNKITRWFSAAEYENMFRDRFDSYYGKSFSVSYNRFGYHYLVVFARQ